MDSGLHQLLPPFGSLMLMSNLQTEYMFNSNMLNQNSFDDRIEDCDLSGFDVSEVTSIVDDSKDYTEDELVDLIMSEWLNDTKTMEVIMNGDYFYDGKSSSVKDSVYSITENEYGEWLEWYFNDVMYLTLSLSN